MEKLKNNPQAKQILNATERHLHRIFLASAIFAALSCFSRADYNLPMYAFLYLMWDQDDVSSFQLHTFVQNDKVKLMALMVVTFIGDFLWMFYWVPHYWSTEMSKYQSGLHTFVILCTFINWIMKLAVLVMLGVTKENELKNSIGKLRNRQ